MGRMLWFDLNLNLKFSSMNNKRCNNDKERIHSIYLDSIFPYALTKITAKCSGKVMYSYFCRYIHTNLHIYVHAYVYRICRCKVGFLFMELHRFVDHIFLQAYEGIHFTIDICTYICICMYQDEMISDCWLWNWHLTVLWAILNMKIISVICCSIVSTYII